MWHTIVYSSTHLTSGAIFDHEPNMFVVDMFCYDDVFNGFRKEVCDALPQTRRVSAAAQVPHKLPRWLVGSRPRHTLHNIQHHLVATGGKETKHVTFSTTKSYVLCS